MHLSNRLRIAATAALLTGAGCSSQPPEADPTERPPAAAPAAEGRSFGLFGGTHARGNVVTFNPKDLGADWKTSKLVSLETGAGVWLVTAKGVMRATVEGVSLARQESDPAFFTNGTIALRIRTDLPLEEGIVVVSLTEPHERTWTTRGPTEDERVFVEEDAKRRFQEITGKADAEPSPGVGAFVMDTEEGGFMITAFRLPGDGDPAHTVVFRNETGAGWAEIAAFNSDFSPRIPFMDVDGDGVPELLHGGPRWDLSAFHPRAETILTVSP